MAAVEGAGFEAKLLGSGGEARLLLAVGGMVCTQCSAAVEGALRAHEGVVRATASLISNQAEARPRCGSPESSLAPCEMPYADGMLTWMGCVAQRAFAHCAEGARGQWMAGGGLHAGPGLDCPCTGHLV